MKLTLIINAGPNGSGKTSVTSKILQHEWVKDCTYINPDQIAQDKFGDWNSPEAVLKAVQYAESLRESALESKKGICFETVFSSPDKVNYLIRAMKSGFFIRFFFVCTANPEINASRIVRRVTQGGHDVPINKIVSRYSKSIANCCAILKIVDRAYIYDNTKEFLDPLLLFRTVDGNLEKQYTVIPQWSLPLIESINN